jgi:hypothetical protein
VPDLVSSARQAVKTARLIAETNYGGWTVRAYFGASPEGPDVDATLAYSACAVTPNSEQSRKPDLLGVAQAILIEAGSTGVLWIQADTRSGLTRKLKLALRGFQWSARKHEHQ